MVGKEGALFLCLIKIYKVLWIVLIMPKKPKKNNQSGNIYSSDGLSKPYVPPRQPSDYSLSSTTDSLAGVESEGRVVLPEKLSKKHRAQSSNPELKRLYTDKNLDFHASESELAQSTPKEEPLWKRLIWLGRDPNYSSPSLGIRHAKEQKGKPQYWTPKGGGLSKFATDRDIIEGLTGERKYQGSDLPVQKILKLTPDQARVIASAYIHEGDRYAKSSDKGAVQSALNSYTMAEYAYKMVGDSKSAQSVERKYGQTLRKLSSDKEAIKRQRKIHEETIRGATKGGLERGIVSSIIAIAGLGVGLFFLSSNITGNAIADLSVKSSSFLGAGLLIVGLVAGFFWLRRNK